MPEIGASFLGDAFFGDFLRGTAFFSEAFLAEDPATVFVPAVIFAGFVVLVAFPFLFTLLSPNEVLSTCCSEIKI